MKKSERDDIALQLFLKRVGTRYLTEETRKHYRAEVDQAYELTDLFLQRRAELKEKKDDKE